jgi:5-bromo-4-chloroindolyl phosphate hydrolysis protein
MAEWEKEIAELKTDVRYIREDLNIMQKQIRDLNKTSNMGVGGIKVFLAIGGVLTAIWAFMKITN